MAKIRKRTWNTKDGEKSAWVVDYFAKDPKTGNRRRHIKTFEKKRDAESWWEGQASYEVQRGTHTPSSVSVTVDEAAKRWLAKCERDGLERSTLDQYRQHVDYHINPLVGETRLSDLTVPFVRNLEDRLATTGDRTATMIRKVITSLGAILRNAQEEGLVSQNVVRELSGGRKRRGEAGKRHKRKLKVGVDIPTPDEAGAIIRAAPDRYRALLIVAIFAGLRSSELRGLRWSDVDLEKSQIHVSQRADRYNKIGSPKSEDGERTIPIGPFVVNTLKEWNLACPNSDLNLVFPNGAGKVESHANIINRGLARAEIDGEVSAESGKTDKHGKPVMKPKYSGLHALRHFFASWCINRVQDGGLGLPTKMVQERMGHSSIVITLDTYGHLFKADDDFDALGQAEALLLGQA